MSDAIAAILMYHRISDTGADRELLCVPPREFAAQMRQLRRDGYSVVPLDTIADGLERGDLPARTVAITFDDGYLDSLTVAAPILGEYGLPGSFFVVTGTVDAPREFWWDTLERILGDDCATPDRLEIRLSGEPVELATTDPTLRRTARQRITQSLIPLAREDRDAIVGELVRWNGGVGAARGDARAMTGDEIRELAALPGISVGSHTVSHLFLPAQTTAVKRAELTESRRALEALLDRRITTLCYPYGGFDAGTIAAARDAGYRCAISTGNLPVVRASDSFAIPRLAVRAGDDLADKLQGVFG